MRKNIVQSKNEPDKNNLWLSEEGLKKYGNNGWELIGGKGGGVTDTTPITDSLNGDELIPVRQNGEDKAVSADTLIKGGKEIYSLTLNTDGTTDYNKLKEAIESDKMITLGGRLLYGVIQSSSILLILSTTADDGNGNITTGVVRYLVYPSGNITASDNSVTIHKDGDGNKFLSDNGSYKEISSEPYDWDGTIDETKFAELKAAIQAGRTIRITDEDRLSGAVTCANTTIYEESGDEFIILIVKHITGVTLTYMMTEGEVVTYTTQDILTKVDATFVCYLYSYSIINVTYKRQIVLSTIDDMFANNRCNSYQGELIFGDTLYDVTFPDTVIWDVTPVYRPNKRYQFSIVNNLGVMREFPLSNS